MKDRLYVVAVFAAVAVMAVVVVVVLRLGQKDPSPPSLRDHPRPEIAGTIVYVDDDGCIQKLAASGQGPREKVTCPGQPQVVTWVDAGTIAFAGPGTTRWILVDLATKKETSGAPFDQSKPPPFPRENVVSPRGEQVSIGSDGSVFRSNGERVKIFTFDGPGDTQPMFATWSPDGEWVLLRYFRENELWIVRRDGSVAGTLTGGATGSASWWIDGAGYLPKVDATIR
jgi:hypothetical protein